MKKRLCLPIFVLALLITGTLWAADAPATRESPSQPAAEMVSPEPGCGTAMLSDELFQNFTPATPPAPQPKAGGTWTYGGCQCYTNCTAAQCICSHLSCCSACCADAKRNLC